MFMHAYFLESKPLLVSAVYISVHACMHHIPGIELEALACKNMQ